MAIETDDDGRLLSLPFQAEEMSFVRMRQADLARLFGVSRARVSQWVKRGQITAYADGRIDPSRAAAELVKNCDVNRLQAKPFKPLRKELDEVRAQHVELKRRHDALAADVDHLRETGRLLLRLALENDLWLSRFFAAAGELADPEQVQAAFDRAGDEATDATLADLTQTADPDLSPVIALLHPELAPAVGTAPPADSRP